MKHVITLCRAPGADIEILQEVSPFVPQNRVFIIPTGTTLEHCAKEYKDKLEELQKRYEYLERARSWILRNIRNGRD
jgi:hypothetical protein